MQTSAEALRLGGVRRGAMAIGLLAAATLVAGFWMIFFHAPTEAEMGVVQRIFYVHVPSAWVAFLAFGIVALCSVGYLWLKDERLDAISVAAAELGIVFTTAVLLTGPLWGKIAWGAWWVWEPRLTLTLLLWFIYLGYFMVRGATENPERGKRFAAIVGVVGAVDIPLIHLSVQWFRSQHPKPVILNPEGPTADPEIVQTLLVCLLGFTLVFFSLLLARYAVQRAEERVEAIKLTGALRGAALAAALLLAAPAAPALAQDSVPAAAPAPVLLADTTAGPVAAAPAPQNAALLRTAQSPPPATMRAYAHVFAAFAIVWALLFGYTVYLGRKMGRLERDVDALGGGGRGA